MRIPLIFALSLYVALGAGCRTAYYSALEKVGVHKRDLLKKRVVQARDDQQAAAEQFKDALTRLKEISGFQGGDLEKVYNDLKSDYDRSASRASAVRDRIRAIESVAQDLFQEWESEIDQISTESLKSASRQQLAQTRQRYEDLHRALVRAEKSMTPVLTRLNDQVLFLKHNLNAAAIASLKGETINIQQEISRLLSDMNTAIEKADAFIKQIE